MWPSMLPCLLKKERVPSCQLSLDIWHQFLLTTSKSLLHGISYSSGCLLTLGTSF